MKKTTTNTGKNNKKIKDNKKVSNTAKDIIQILPLMMIVFFLPFIIRLTFIDLNGPFYDYWIGGTVNSDFFTYYKKIFIYITTFWAVLHTYFFVDKINKTRAYYFMAGYFILVVLSTIFSDYPQIALHGFNERHEGMWVILCYLLLMFSSINLIRNENQIKAIILSLGLSGFIIALISIFQYYKMDIFNTEFVKNIMISSKDRLFVGDIDRRFGRQSGVIGVFYNPNYLGVYMSFYAVLFLSYSFYTKKNFEKVLYIIFFTTSSISLFFSKSDAGILAYFFSIIVFIVSLTLFQFKSYIKNEGSKKSLKKSLFSLGAIIIVIASVYSYNSSRIDMMIREFGQIFKTTEISSNYRDVGPLKGIRNIDSKEIEINIEDNIYRVKVENGNFGISYNDESIYLDSIKKSLENHPLKNTDENHILLTTYPLSFEDNNSIGLRIHFNEENNIRLYVRADFNQLSLTDFKFQDIEIKDAKFVNFFEGKGRLGSGRFYIWSRSIPLVLNNILIGTGQDTFITVFPQYDFYGKQVEIGSESWNMWNITDKPHNTYLQIAIQSGLLSLLVFIIGVISLLAISFKEFWRSGEIIYVSLNISILSFLVSSIFNDSIIGITPIVMILIGILSFLTIDIKIKDKAVKNNE